MNRFIGVGCNLLGLLVVIAGPTVFSQSGQPDPTFQSGTGADGTIFSMALRRDGRIVACGAFHSFNGNEQHSYLRLHPDGSLDRSFQPPNMFGTYNYAVALDSLDRVVGSSSAEGGTPMPRFLENGTVDPNFNAPGGGVYWIGIDLSHHIFVTGGTMIKLFPDGTRDYSFNIGRRRPSDRGIYAGALKTNGNAVLGGEFYYVADEFRAHIAEVDSFGRLITNAFTVGVDGFGVYELCLQPDQKVIAGGDFEGSVVRYTGDGQVDDAFRPPYIADWDGWPGPIYALALQPDGKILIGGQFTSIGDVPATNIARLHPDGSLDSTFQVGAEMNREVAAIVVQPDGRIVIAGGFSSFNGVPAGHIVRLLGDRPVLDTQRGDSNETILKWPAAYTNYVLQTSSDLLATNWSTITNAPTLIRNLCVVTNPIADGNRFFRLVKP